MSNTLKRKKVKTRVQGQLLEGIIWDIKGTDFTCFVVINAFSAQIFH